MLSESSNRRAVPRVEVALTGLMWSEDGCQQVQCRDLSLGGVGLVAFRSPPVGSRVRLQLWMDDTFLDAECEVVRDAGVPGDLISLRLVERDRDVLIGMFDGLRRHALKPAPHFGYFADEVGTVEQAIA